MAELEFTWDSRDLDVWRNAKVDKALLRALTKAGNDAARAMKAASNRAVRQRKRLKISRVNEGLPLTFPKSKELAHLAWRMDVSSKPIPVADFPHRQVRKGVSVAISGGSRKLIKSAFVATMRSGHEGVFRRVGKARLPIKELFTSKISDVFNDDGMVPAVWARTEFEFNSTFSRLLPLELEKIKR